MIPFRIVAALAAAQHGVVSRRQLLAEGLSGEVIDRLVSVSYLHVLHRGVYAVGHLATSEDSGLMAATLTAGPEAAVSHGSAALRLGIDTGGRARPRVDIIVLRGRCRSRPGIRYHRTRHLPAEDRIDVDGIPVTSVARTLRDLARSLSYGRLRRLFDEADRIGKLDRPELEVVLERSRGHRGVGMLVGLSRLNAKPAPRTRSPLEHRFYRLWESTGLPLPEMNVRLLGYEVDCFWRRSRVVVELDGREFHRTRLALERDEIKDAVLKNAGYTVRRFTYWDVFKRPDWVIGEVRNELARAQND